MNISRLQTDLPKGGPDIMGGQPRYNVNDKVNVTCVSRDSYPAAELAWYINGEKADRHFLIQQKDEAGPDGLFTARLGLQFKVRVMLLLLMLLLLCGGGSGWGCSSR